MGRGGVILYYVDIFNEIRLRAVAESRGTYGGDYIPFGVSKPRPGGNVAFFSMTWFPRKPEHK